MLELTAKQFIDLTAERADLLINGLDELNAQAQGRPLIEPQMLRSVFLSIVARYLTDTCVISEDQKGPGMVVPPTVAKA